MTLLHADNRAYLTAEYNERYALGPLDAPLIVFNTADDQGCAWLANVDGWHAPEVSTPLDRRPDGHGGFVGSSTYDPRTLSVEGSVTAPSRAALAAARQRFLGAILGDLTGFLRYTHLDEDTGPRGLWVRITGQPKWAELDDRAADFACVLLAEDPIRTGPQVTYGPVRLAGTVAEGGYPMPLTMPTTSAGAVAGTVVTRVRNDGDEDAHAVYRIQGPVPQPLVQLGTGEQIWLKLDLGALDTATVDTAAGTVDVNGVLRYDAWGAGSTFPLIPPGGAEARLRSFTGGADPAAALYVDSAPSWR